MTVEVRGQRAYPADAATVPYLGVLLRRLGYRPRPRLFASPADFERPIASGRFQAATNAWFADFPSASQWIGLLLGCAPGEGPSHGGFCDPRIDALARRAVQLQVARPAESNAMWARADRLVTNAAPWVPTVQDQMTAVLSERVGDFRFLPDPFVLLDQLWVR
jgi:ABC-type oligopeptide transport system substrate-binding subunit